MKNILIGIIFGIGLLTSSRELYGEKLIQIKGLYWKSNLEGDVKVETQLLGGTNLSLSRSLGVDENAFIPEVELKINLPLMGKLVGSFWTATYQGEKIIPQNINFAGQTFPANELVQTNLALSMGTLLYEMTIIPEGLTKIFFFLASAQGGFQLGIKYFYAQVSLTSSSTGTIKETLGVPIPLIGLFLRGEILNNLKIETAFTYFGAGIADVTARLLDAYAEVKLYLGPIPLGLGYKITTPNFKHKSSETAEVNFCLKGFYFTTFFGF